MRTILAGALIVVAVTVSSCRIGTSDAEWPTQPVRVIVPFGPGSGVDLAARLFASQLSVLWHQAVVVDNRAGTDGVVGTEAFVTAHDRHTLLFATAGPFTFGPYLHDPLPYDPATDVVPISAAGNATLAIAVVSSVPATSLSELSARIRAHPGTYLWTASPGGPELMLKAFAERERLDTRQVRYRETTTSLQDLAAGRVHVVLASLPTIFPLVKAGSLRVLAVTNAARAAAIPDVPTVAEAGFPALTVDGLWGFFGWKAMPDALRRRIAADIVHAASDPTLVERLATVGLPVHAGTPEAFASALDLQRRQIAGLVKPATAGQH